MCFVLGFQWNFLIIICRIMTTNIIRTNMTMLTNAYPAGKETVQLTLNLNISEYVFLTIWPESVSCIKQSSSNQRCHRGSQRRSHEYHPHAKSSLIWLRYIGYKWELAEDPNRETSHQRRWYWWQDDVLFRPHDERRVQYRDYAADNSGHQVNVHQSLSSKYVCPGPYIKLH